MLIEGACKTISSWFQKTRTLNKFYTETLPAKCFGNYSRLSRVSASVWLAPGSESAFSPCATIFQHSHSSFLLLLCSNIFSYLFCFFIMYSKLVSDYNIPSNRMWSCCFFFLLYDGEWKSFFFGNFEHFLY